MPASQIQRLWLLLGGIVAVVMLLVGWFMFISPQRSQTSSVNGQVSGAHQQNSVLKARIKSLQAQNANLAQYEAEVKQAKLALPDASGLSDFLRTLQSIGNATQTNVTTLTVGAPTNLAVTTSTAGGAASSTAPKPGVAPSPSAIGPLGTIYQLPISLSVSGSTAQLDEFLSQLQSVQPRAVLITQLTEGGQAQAATGKSSATTSVLSLTMQAFVAPSSAAENAQLAAGVKPVK